MSGGGNGRSGRDGFLKGLPLGFVFGWMFGWVFGIVPGCVLGFVPGTEGPVLALSIVGWRSRWKKFAATWNVEEEQEGFCLWRVCQVEVEWVHLERRV